jgi:hypothetical protein
MTNLAETSVSDNTVKRDSPRWIVWGNGRRIEHSWATVYAFAIKHQWGFIRLGDCLVGFPADVTEGHG